MADGGSGTKRSILSQSSESEPSRKKTKGAAPSTPSSSSTDQTVDPPHVQVGSGGGGGGPADGGGSGTNTGRLNLPHVTTFCSYMVVLNDPHNLRIRKKYSKATKRGTITYGDDITKNPQKGTKPGNGSSWAFNVPDDDQLEALKQAFEWYKANLDPGVEPAECAKTQMTEDELKAFCGKVRFCVCIACL